MSHPTGVPHHGMTKFCRKNSDRRSREKLLNVGIWSLLHTNKEITNKRSPSNRWCTSKQPENVTNNFCILRCFSHCKWKHDWRKDYNFPKTKLNMQFPIPLYSHRDRILLFVLWFWANNSNMTETEKSRSYEGVGYDVIWIWILTNPSFSRCCHRQAPNCGSKFVLTSLIHN